MTTECCTQNPGSTADYPKTLCCPVNGQEYNRVPLKTVLQNTHYPNNQSIKSQGYYFCTSPECEVVYFGEDGYLVKTNEVREQIGEKQAGGNRMLCYCFDISENDINTEINTYGFSPSFDFIVEQTKQGNCSCQSRNPSGRCCLGSFPGKARAQRSRK